MSGGESTRPHLGPAVPIQPYWRFISAVVRVLYRALWGLEIRGLENIPPTGGCLIAANHIAFYDPPAVGGSASREVWFLAKQELFAVPVLGALIRWHNSIPIRRASSDRAGVERAIALVESGRALVIFPEGGRSIPGVFRPPKPGVATIALEAGGAPIVPAYISGTRPIYRALLRRPRVRVVFGPPVWPREVEGLRGLNDKDAARALARVVMDSVAAMAVGERAAGR